MAIFVRMPSFWNIYWIANPFRSVEKMWVKTRTKIRRVKRIKTMSDFCSLLLGLLMIINGVGMVRLHRKGFRGDLDSFLS